MCKTSALSTALLCLVWTTDIEASVFAHRGLVVFLVLYRTKTLRDESAGLVELKFVRGAFLCPSLLRKGAGRRGGLPPGARQIKRRRNMCRLGGWLQGHIGWLERRGKLRMRAIIQLARI
jgi:hypothetical protein